jgi:hypothetical protein
VTTQPERDPLAVDTEDGFIGRLLDDLGSVVSHIIKARTPGADLRWAIIIWPHEQPGLQGAVSSAEPREMCEVLKRVAGQPENMTQGQTGEERALRRGKGRHDG